MFYTTILANLIINHYYTHSRCLLIFTDETGDFGYFGPIPAVKIRTSNNSIQSDVIFNYYGCQGVIIQVKKPQEVLSELEHQIRSSIERFNERRYLILPTENGSIKNLFNSKELDYISDFLVVTLDNTHQSVRDGFKIENDPQTFLLKTHKYVGRSDNNDPVLVDKWFSGNQSFLLGTDLFPDKISDQQGRKLRMATFTYEPYSVVGETLHGSELATAVHYALKHNMTPIPIVNEKDYWGDIFGNWTGNGLLGNLVDDNADIGFAALYTWEFCYHYLDLSKPLVRTGITCLVPAPKLAAGWLTPLLSYTTQLWIGVSITFLLSTLALSLFLYFYNTNEVMRKIDAGRKSTYVNFLGLAIVKVFKPFILQSLTQTEIPKEVNSKFVMLLVMVLGLFLTSTYSSGFASVMTIPRYEHAIDTVEQFARSGLSWGATQDAWIMSIQNAEEPDYVEIVNKFTPTSEENLQAHSKTGKFAFSIERLPFENFAIGTYLQEDVIDDFHLMQEDLYWEQCVIMTKKSSILLPSIDIFVLRVFQAGLISRWQNKAVTLYMDPKVQKAVKYYKHRHLEHGVVKIKWHHVQGAFAVLTIGYCVSLVFLLLEVTAHRNRHQKLLEALKNKRLVLKIIDVRETPKFDYCN